MKTMIKAWLHIATLGACLSYPYAIGAKGLSPNDNVSTAADAAVLDMATAFQKNDSRTLTRLLPRAKGSILEPWAAYWEIKARISDINQSDIDRFAKRYPNTYVEDRLRADWLLLLGQRRDWSAFAANLPAYRMRDDKDIRCYALHVAYVSTGAVDATTTEQLWMSQKDTNTGCAYAANALIDAGSMDPVVAWRKAYKGQPPAQAAWDKLRPEQKNWAWGFEGKSLAQKLDLAALQSFANVTRPQDLSDDMLGWWTRAALRSKNWPLVRRVIGAMTADGQKEWAAWLGVAAHQGQYVLVAPTPVGEMPAEKNLGAKASLAEVGALPGLTRALHAIHTGLRPEGVREWNYEVNLARGSMNDADRIAAAELACAAQVWDRCINTSERTVGVINWQQRYPVPFKAAITAAAQAQGLEPAFVFGLIRQESRFIRDAKSYVGAAGLMQLMPPTAKWTAKRIGLQNFTADQVNDISTNVQLGAGYLKYVLDAFGGNTALAAAAYNAGPQRVRQWTAAMAADTGVSTPLDLAIWSENIPFLETRDYVKKVLANTEVYRALLR